MAWRSKPSKLYKPRDPRVTSEMMSSVKNKGGKAEMLLRKSLHALGYRYRLHTRKLIGRPDIVFGPKRVIVFVDGDFWHGRVLIEDGVQGLRDGLRTERSDWWVEKIKKTVARDRLVTHQLEKDGWIVLRFWESEVLSDLESVTSQIQSFLL